MRSLAAPFVLVLVLALLAPAAARAQVRCPDEAPALAPFPVEQRIAFLRGRLHAEQGPALAWTWTFGAVNAALTAGQLAGAAIVPRGPERAILLAGAATSALGVAQIVLAPIAPTDRDLAAGGGDLCADLRRLEDALRRGARNERLGTGPAAQVGNLAINAGFGIATGLVGHKAGSGLLTFALGWALGELQILTEPTGLIEGLRRYRAGELDAPSGAAGPGRPRWSVVVAGASVAVRWEY